MRRFRWKWILPTAQLVFASFCLIYGPHQYRVRVRLDGAVGDNNMLEYAAQNAPAPIERISKGVNFPALVLDYPLREYDNALYSHNSAYTLIWVSPSEVGFFAGIAIFWYWLGRKLDQRRGGSPRTTRPRKVRIAGLMCGLLFGILTGAYAIQITASRFRPERQIGAFGIVWSLALTACFAWHLRQELRLS